MTLIEQFGATVRAERARRNWRQIDLADVAGVSLAYVVRIENNQTPHLSLVKAMDVAGVLGISLDAMQRREATWPRSQAQDVAEASGRG